MMLSFPRFELTFNVYTDASDYQLRGVVSQELKPVTAFLGKLAHNRRI